MDGKIREHTVRERKKKGYLERGRERERVDKSIDGYIDR